MGQEHPAENSGGASKSKKDVDLPPESLPDFKKALDQLLIQLGESEAHHDKITKHQVANGAFGTIPQAAGLAGAYASAHARVLQFSQTLGS
ncbi:hypothetical protein [Streptomyces sp. XD-27]|uniref:hypothetical protein n=1 Tax=Streptomyces sp. XD-27 TaxID=3062779 RepID=UPI0026F4628F|nr:hypothetical protein [Streptomyces sp. XD-27]WKX72909.1 hypothetical protein Q3Y56_26115 [Streptomyces sp. XD-27]